MVECLLAKAKTQTRRKLDVKLPNFYRPEDRIAVEKRKNTIAFYDNQRNDAFSNLFSMPSKYNVDDVLWVRESTATHFKKKVGGKSLMYLIYKAGLLIDDGDYKWKPGIHMPFDACRIFLKITDVRVERLQSISESDAEAEGMNLIDPILQCWYTFQSVWIDINGVESWEANPWIYAITFEEITKAEALTLTAK